jgi:hypothetical protein
MLKKLLAKLPQQKGKKATPEEEFAAYRYFEKLMTVYSISMSCGKIMSVLFYTWALFGLFSVQIVYEFSLARIASLSMACAAPYILCAGGSWEAKNFLGRMVHIPFEQKDQLFKAYQSMQNVSLLLMWSHGGIAFISNILRLPNFSGG